MRRLFLSIFIACLFSVYAEIVTCPHCHKTFDTKDPVNVTKDFIETDYEEYSVSKLYLIGKNNIGKKICLPYGYISAIDKDGLIAIGDAQSGKSIDFCVYDESLVDEIINLYNLTLRYAKDKDPKVSQEDILRKMYGIIETGKLGKVIFHVTRIEK